jgi:RNA-dependent RNA polymerase
MFRSETVLFSREPPSPSLFPTREAPKQPRQEPAPHIIKPSLTVASNATPVKATRQKMNLNKPILKPQPEWTPRPENPRQERKLQHRLSALGQRARLEKIEFGVLRDRNFSVEYSRELLDSGGDLSFEDDEKSLRVIMGGTHQDPIMPSIVIAIQTINYVALGNDFGVPYMFLELLQNPHFERGDAARRSTGNAKEDVRHSRTRHSALDPKHRRVAPYASRWLKMNFYSDGFYPDSELCLLAGLPVPDTNPSLTFDKREMYSLRNVEALEKWLQSGSLPWEVAFQCEALFRNGALVPKELLSLRPSVERLVKESPARACDALKSFRVKVEGGRARKTFNDFKGETVVTAFEKDINSSSKAVPFGRLQAGSSKSNFLCHHVKITPTAVFLAGRSNLCNPQSDCN